MTDETIATAASEIGNARRQAQAPHTATFVRLGRRVWLTLESCHRGAASQQQQLEDNLRAVGQQLQGTEAAEESGYTWDNWEQRRLWSDAQWRAFLIGWKTRSLQVFATAEGEEAELMRAFDMYWMWYVCLPERPENIPPQETLESTAARVDSLLQTLERRVGNPLSTCALCHKGALGYKLYRCSRCKCANYCTQECQKADWKTHKKSCKPLNP